MAVFFSQIKTLDGLQKDLLPLQSIPPPPPVPPAPPSSSSSSRISPAVLFIIVILAVIFFVSGLLHLLVRFFIKKSPSSSSSRPNRQSSTGGGEISGSDALQRQLQQLFHLHDSGLDQAFIDALPVFLYRELIGSKEPFDCAVCLCEFSGDDKLRLLPICGHAFHLACIDTWLLSNSTCPLCRGALFVPGLAIENPIFDFDDPAAAEEGTLEAGLKPGEVFPVRLGKFRRLSNGESDGSESNHDQNNGNNGMLRREEGESSSSNLDARRCYSMGSYQYVVGDANLRVALRSGSATRRKGRGLVASTNHNPPSIVEDGGMEGKKLGIASKGESFSVSKIWLWSNKKGNLPGSAADDAASLDGGLPWMRRSSGDS